MLIDCETCDGTGEAMNVVCYGGPPIELRGICPDCEDGQIEIEDKPPAPPKSRNAREGWYAGKQLCMVGTDWVFGKRHCRTQGFFSPLRNREGQS